MYVLYAVLVVGCELCVTGLLLGAILDRASVPPSWLHDAWLIAVFSLSLLPPSVPLAPSELQEVHHRHRRRCLWSRTGLRMAQVWSPGEFGVVVVVVLKLARVASWAVGT